MYWAETDLGRLLLQGLEADQTLEMCLLVGWDLGSLKPYLPQEPKVKQGCVADLPCLASMGEAQIALLF